MNFKSGILIFFFLLIPFYLNAQNFFDKITHPDEFGVGFVATHQDGLGATTAAGPGGEIFLKYNISPRVFFTFGGGISTITDELLKSNTFTTTLLPNVELKLGVNLIRYGNFKPFIFGGLHAFGWKSTVTVATISSSTGPYYDGGVIIGGGASLRVNDKLSIFASGDYRYNLTASVDPKPQYYTAKGGISYAMGYQPSVKKEEIEYPLNKDELVLEDLFKEEKSGDVTKEDQDALSLLFQSETDTETAAATEEGYYDNTLPTKSYPNTEIGKLMETIDDLKSTIEKREKQIMELQDQVRANEKAIAEITRRSAVQYTTGSSGSFGVEDTEMFKQRYKLGLQNFYNKNFNEAIKIFSSLLSSNPDHRLASNCQYWIGECYNAMKDYRKAIEAFTQVLNYRYSYKLDDALLMSGICNLKIGNRITAREKFQELLSRFPESEYAPKAIRYLGRL